MDQHDDVNYPAEWFDEALSRERAWLTEAHELIRKLQGDIAVLTIPKDEEASIELLEALAMKIGELLLDGDTVAASKSIVETFKVSESRMEVIVERTANRVLAEFEEAFLFRQAIKRIEAVIPQMNPASDIFEPSSIGEVKSLMRGYIENEGLSPCEALEKSVGRLYSDFFQGGTEISNKGLRSPQEGLSKIRFCLSKDGRFVIG